MSPQKAARRKLARRACDGCKIRKIKCSEISPCLGCEGAGIPCTFNKLSATRGPRALRAKTFQSIAESQNRVQGGANHVGILSSGNASSDPGIRPEAASLKIPVPSLVLRLCVYRLRLYPIWPIVAVESVIASLQRDSHDMEAYALANALGAATAAQLKGNRSDFDTITASAMEEECQRSKLLIKGGSPVNLNGLRIAFFLHIYHENQQPGGVKSLLYLREAITLAQILGLHREKTYATLSSPEQQVSRRILWLLFVTERGVAMLHKLPVILKSNVQFPYMEGEDEMNVLPAFQKLINLFWLFDQSGAFDILENSDASPFNFGEMGSTSRECLVSLQKKLEDVPMDWEVSNDVQRADICATRQWMRAVLWSVYMDHGRSQPMDQVISMSLPFQIAREFLVAISQLPNTAIEAHGPTMELKIFGIANAVAEALASNNQTSWISMDPPRDLLNSLQRILASFRRTNKILLSSLYGKIGSLRQDAQILIEPSSRSVEELDEQWPDDSPNVESALDIRTNSTSPGNVERFMSPTYYRTQQTAPQFDRSWLESPALTTPSRNLFEQLQNFNGSFSPGESCDVLDQLLSVRTWDDTTDLG